MKFKTEGTHFAQNNWMPPVKEFLFTGATTLYGSLPPPWFRNSTLFHGGVINATPNPQPVGPGTRHRLAPTLWPVCHGWSYQELSLPATLPSCLVGHENPLFTIITFSSQPLLISQSLFPLHGTDCVLSRYYQTFATSLFILHYYYSFRTILLRFPHARFIYSPYH
jgi:hypothetical protein